MGLGARREQSRSQWLHAGRRFGDVIVSPDADHELNWIHNEAEPQTGLPSLQGGFPDGPSPCSLEAEVARADARHAARKIKGRFEQLDVRDWRILDARMIGRTAATTTTQWLEELAASRSDDLTGWHKQAVHECERAITAYQRARGNDPSVAPKVQRW